MTATVHKFPTDRLARTEFVPVTEVAKLLRRRLKEEFPGVKFSVRSHSYAGGASIRVAWTDGPREADVAAVTRPYSGAGFDGMTDLKYHYDTYLDAEGRVVGRRTVGSTGTDPEFDDAPPTAVRAVAFGADFVFTRREFTDRDALFERAADLIREKCRCEGTPPNDRCGNEWVTDLAYRVVRETDADLDLERGFRRGVLREED